jgi:hypothetical protein
MDEPNAFAIHILGNEYVAIFWSLFEMMAQAFAYHFDALVSLAPGWQWRFDEAWRQCHDEVIVVFFG